MERKFFDLWKLKICGSNFQKPFLSGKCGCFVRQKFVRKISVNCEKPGYRLFAAQHFKPETVDAKIQPRS